MTRIVTTMTVALVLLASWMPPRADGQALAPLRSLPPYMRVLVDWGVRPEWSLDGRSLLFMERGLGDAYRLDVETGRLTPLTAHFYNQGFDRVLPLANGDYLLTGPRAVDPKDPWSQRHTGFEMFVLDRSLTKPPVPLGTSSPTESWLISRSSMMRSSGVMFGVTRSRSTASLNAVVVSPLADDC